MAASNPKMSLVKRPSNDMALMPPPPFKRIKRPPKVLDEDEYTAVLSDIIARDYFPGLRETKAQQEYLAALESENEAWIAEAGHKLRETMNPSPANKSRRSSRNTRFNTPSQTPGATPAYDTPRGFTGSETPYSVASSASEKTGSAGRELDTTNLSLSSFQAKYTSEDNESFNALLDKQNEKRRNKNAHLWTQDQRVPSARQIAYRARETRLLKQQEEDEAKGKALIPITTGATISRPARPDSWHIKKPDNTFMFNASSVDEDGLSTIQEMKESTSKAAPKQVVYSNTRFQPTYNLEDPGPVPSSPSLNTDVIAQRDAHRANNAPSESDFPGGETPRVNGYAYVDEDEPEDIPVQAPSGPSYRDLLAGQVGDATPNPFSIGSVRRREDLHHRMVEKSAKQKRTKEKETVRVGTPVGQEAKKGGEMTPAARKLMERLGRTPVAQQKGKEQRMSSKEMWTPTPRRKVGAKG